jgi:hypothetical protein
MGADFPAAHSMDTTWFAVDEDGYVGYFISDTQGLVPCAALSNEEYDEALRALMALAPPGKEVLRLEEYFGEPWRVADLGAFVYQAIGS